MFTEESVGVLLVLIPVIILVAWGMSCRISRAIEESAKSLEQAWRSEQQQRAAAAQAMTERLRADVKNRRSRLAQVEPDVPARPDDVRIL